MSVDIVQRLLLILQYHQNFPCLSKIETNFFLSCFSLFSMHQFDLSVTSTSQTFRKDGQSLRQVEPDNCFLSFVLHPRNSLQRNIKFASLGNVSGKQRLMFYKNALQKLNSLIAIHDQKKHKDTLEHETSK